MCICGWNIGIVEDPKNTENETPPNKQRDTGNINSLLTLAYKLSVGITHMKGNEV